MPRKRSIDVRLAEAQERLDRIELERRILELRARLPRRRRRTRDITGRFRP